MHPAGDILLCFHHILEIIAKYLTPTDLQHCILVNKTWHNLFSSHLWTTLTIQSKKLRALDGSPAGKHALAHLHSHHIRHLSTLRWEILPRLSSCPQLKTLSFLHQPTWEYRDALNHDRDDFGILWDDVDFFRELFEFLKGTLILEAFRMDAFPAEDFKSSMLVLECVLLDRNGRDLGRMNTLELFGKRASGGRPRVEEWILLQVVRRACGVLPNLERLQLGFTVQRMATAEEIAELCEEDIKGVVWPVRHLALAARQGDESPVPHLVLVEMLRKCPWIETLELGFVQNKELELVRDHLGERPVAPVMYLTPTSSTNCLRGLTIHRISRTITDRALAGVLNILAPGQLSQIHICLPEPSNMSCLALERQASSLEDVVLRCPYNKGQGPPVIQYLLSHAPKLKRIKALDGHLVIYLSAAEILLGDPWVCSGLEEWAMGIRGIPKCPLQSSSLLMADRQTSDLDSASNESVPAEDDFQETLRRERHRLDMYVGEILKPKAGGTGPSDALTFESGSGVLPATSLTPMRVKSLVIQRAILAKLGTLSRLRILNLSPNYEREQGGLEFSLESGLDLLKGCTRLEELNIRGYDNWIGYEELEWMRRHWPKINKLFGLDVLNGLRRPDVKLNAWVKEHWPGVHVSNG